MSRTFDLEITDDNIACGRFKDPQRCPIALAFREACPAATGIVVTGDGIHCDVDDEGLLGPLPPEALEFIDAFDSGDDVEPITIRVTFPHMEPRGEES